MNKEINFQSVKDDNINDKINIEKIEEYKENFKPLKNGRSNKMIKESLNIFNSSTISTKLDLK